MVNRARYLRHSTALAQSLKAVSEVGELADATIKNDLDALKDAIGDVAVCLVNVAYMTDFPLDHVYIFTPTVTACTPQQLAGSVAGAVGDVVFEMARYGELRSGGLDASMYSLYVTSQVNNLDFLDCCSAAWDEIKDRTGHMVAGGAFVKDE